MQALHGVFPYISGEAPLCAYGAYVPVVVSCCACTMALPCRAIAWGVSLHQCMQHVARHRSVPPCASASLGVCMRACVALSHARRPQFACLVALTAFLRRYGFGVGGEYPMASSSAAERASVKPELRAYRGRQVVLVFSNQGLGSLINVLVLTACAAMFGATGDKDTITHDQARKVLCVMYGVGTAACAFMVFYRFVFLRESEVRALLVARPPKNIRQSAHTSV